MPQSSVLSTDQFAILAKLVSERRPSHPVMDHFPAAGLDHMAASLTCYLYLGDGESPDETFSLTTLMSLRRSEPYTNARGLRQIDVRLEGWSAKGFSTVMNRTVECFLSAEAQPRSEIVAERPTSDFPAEVTFRPKLDVAIGGQLVLHGIDGTLHGTGWLSVPPPGGNLLTVDLTIEYGPMRLVVTRCSGNRPREWI